MSVIKEMMEAMRKIGEAKAYVDAAALELAALRARVKKLEMERDTLRKQLDEIEQRDLRNKNE